MKYQNQNEKTLAHFVELITKANYRAMEEILAADLIAYVTNSKGGVDKVIGRSAYMQHFYAMDIPAADKMQLRITQMVSIPPDQILMMLEVNAKKYGKTLLNYAAYLVKFNNKEIQEIWMVEALPEYSEEFWIK